MKDDWFLYGEWKDIPVLSLDSWNCKYNNLNLKEILGDFLDVLMFWKDNHKEIMFVSKSSEEKMLKLVRDKFRSNPKAFDIVLDNYMKKRLAILKRFDEINEMDLSNLSNNDLAEIFLETRKLIGYCGAHDWYPFSIDNRIIEAVDLKEYIDEHKDEESLILSLTLPGAILPTLQEEIEVLKIAIKAKGMSEEEIEKKFSKEITSLAIKFGWLVSLIYYPLKTEKQYIDQVMNLAKNNDLHKELEEKQNFIVNTNKQIKSYIDKYNPPQTVINSIQAIRKLSEIRAWGDMDCLYNMSRCRNLDKEIRKRLSLERDDYLNLYIKEIMGALKDKTKIPDLASRKKIEAFYRHEDADTRRVDNPMELFDKLYKSKKTKGELKGSPGFPGKVTGKVKLIHSSQDIHKFQEGDILVAKATCVDYVAIMKKAGAIVAEFGGITSHAAIISRELKVPSIIGVPTITNVLKDGDLIEVDANKGIVKRI